MTLHSARTDEVFGAIADAAPTEGLRLTVLSLLRRTRDSMPPAEFNQLIYQLRIALRRGPAFKWSWVFYLKRLRYATRRSRRARLVVRQPEDESERRRVQRRAKLVDAYLERQRAKEMQALLRRLDCDSQFLPVYRVRRKRWLTDFLQVHSRLKTGEQIMRWAARLPSMRPRAMAYLSQDLEAHTHLRPALNRPKAAAVWCRFTSPDGTFTGGDIVGESAVGYVTIARRTVHPESLVLKDAAGRKAFQKILGMADPLNPDSVVSTPTMPCMGKLWAFTRWQPAAYLTKATGAEVSHLYAEAHKHLTTYRKAAVRATVVFRIVAVPSRKELWLQLGKYAIGITGRKRTSMDALMQLANQDAWSLATSLCGRHLGYDSMPEVWLDRLNQLDSIAETKAILLNV